MFLEYFSSLKWKYLSLRWHAIFNTHFPVPVNFVLFVYFDVFFSEYLSFLLIIVVCHIIAMVLQHMLKTISKSRHFSMIFFYPASKNIVKSVFSLFGRPVYQSGCRNSGAPKNIFRDFFFQFYFNKKFLI